MTSLNPLSSVGFGTRLTLMILSLIVGAILIVATLIFLQYRASYTDATIDRLHAMGESNAQSFNEWLLGRQDEMRYLAGLDAARGMDLDELEHLIEQIASLRGEYDTIFVVNADGMGEVGVAFDGQARVLSREEANDFNVPDRAWFQSAISGEDTFSRPVVSRATGNRVSTVAIPIEGPDGEPIAVMRGAVQLDTIFDRVNAIDLGEGSEIYLVDRDRHPVTPVESAPDTDQPIDTRAAQAIAAGDSGVGRYQNAIGTAVIGSFTDIPLLGWGLLMELDEGVALAELQRALWWVVGLTIAILIAASLISLGVIRNVLRTLGGDPAYASDVVRQVSEGDMTVPIQLRKDDDSSLLAAIATMQSRLRELIGSVRGHAEEVASAATELSHINEETDKGVNRQNAQLSDAAAAINEMTATVEEVARNSQSTADVVRETTEQAQSGRNVVSASVTSINKLSNEIQSTAEVITALKGDSDNIGDILQVINNVADQTNLLALNAAIEAARAGEDGRGFAVVAEEVRNLAVRTQESITEIQQMIEAVQKRADQAVTAMAASQTQAQDGVDQVNQAGTSLEQIVAAVEKIEDMTRQIASAAEEQSATSNEINRNIHSVSEVSEHNATNVVQMGQASETLAGLSEQLREIVNRFKV
ncbi:methyl-accepting chemotaxis protein [Thioalkalivibrio sp. ALE30]|uniref:methyl-accepting chemotaxis protein n=1 Tax=Thioalkalivibrio sp. ALE30 TaxID=1158181 RepID=UPI0003822D29|nr:methyl-accepting chemotaxis protein [Thioalkalivibrio sp. ALE30]